MGRGEIIPAFFVSYNRILQAIQCTTQFVVGNIAYYAKGFP